MILRQILKLFQKAAGKPPYNLVEHLLPSKHLKRDILVDVYRPASIGPNLQLFVFFDGQDVRTMEVGRLQRQLLKEGYPPIMVVGIHANERRMQEYGTISQPDYAKRGKKAAATADFVIQGLLPYLSQQYNIDLKPATSHIAGFSLSGLLAFDLAWHYPQHFGTAGIFSGSLWWRSEPFDEENPDTNRIVHTQVAAAEELPPVRYWFQAGTEDETSDRNGNGVIDAIDDTVQLVELLKEKGQAEEGIYYLEVEGGRHEPGTWAGVIGEFLRWAQLR
ncbi:MAG: alpha/beta hydrolase-fold protein [Bacteroidota bacterium]